MSDLHASKPQLLGTPEQIRARLTELAIEARALRKALAAAESLERARQLARERDPSWKEAAHA
jgi:hypothetical protein